jgi:hypothetical protein
MSKSKGRKRKNEDEYDLQTILEDDISNDATTEAAVPQASGRNAETNDEAVSFI